jgi:hypothetical protein
MPIKVGDIVRPRVGSYHYEKGDRWLGRVTRVVEGNNTEDHGAIDMVLLEVQSYYLDVGETENYVHYGWWDHLEVVDTGSKTR